MFSSLILSQDDKEETMVLLHINTSEMDPHQLPELQPLMAIEYTPSASGEISVEEFREWLKRFDGDKDGCNKLPYKLEGIPIIYLYILVWKKLVAKSRRHALITPLVRSSFPLLLRPHQQDQAFRRPRLPPPTLPRSHLYTAKPSAHSLRDLQSDIPDLRRRQPETPIPACRPHR